MPVSLQVIYPASAGSRFDHEYYAGTHLPMVSSHLGSHLSSVLVTKGASSAPTYHAIATMVFEDQDALDAAMEAAQPVLEDIPNFTDVKAEILLGEVIVS
ncbi:EthD family reductase [Tranquillimonas alkanivorans]|uniref:EthD domain-containing protein n=1 Tax=Tranquillimonas alkanivorans TaxID=441119 RepID=A0A1I5WE50_9RHOB|nr:EthD family reductase [Tranquillimonas alkanivorans]SFQ17908.1 conserved hypothetical protein [Tranquillimonas alkanivorans]